MIKVKNKALIIYGLLSALLLSCNSNEINNSDEQIIRLKQDGVISSNSNRIYRAKVSEKGATISFVVNTKDKGDFSTKANQNGSVVYTTDITKFIIYLVKNASTTTYPVGGDPLADVVSGPFTVNVNGGGTELIQFTGVPDSLGSAYYVAVKAQNFSSTDLIKPNNGGTAWSGSSANLPLAVSSGAGIIVNNQNQVSSTTPLSVNLNMIDPVGAKIEANVSNNSGAVVSGGAGVNGQLLGRFITTFAGNGTASFVNGTGTNATFNGLHDVTVDSSGNVYVADYNNHSIRKITSSGVVSTLAGNGASGSQDGTGTNARFNLPSGVAVDSAGNVYVAGNLTAKVSKITPAGVATTIAGSGVQSCVDGTGTNATFNVPIKISLDASGNIYVADYHCHKIRKITTTGVVTTFAGSGTGGFADGPATSAQFLNPRGVVVNPLSGDVYTTENGSNRIRKISGGVVTTIAGNGTAGSVDGNGTNARVGNCNGMAVDSQGNVYFTDTFSHKIRKIDSAGNVTTIAGNGTAGFSDGVATSSMLNQPTGVRVDQNGIIYVADPGNSRVRKF